MWQVPNRADVAEVSADSAEIGADAAEVGADSAEIGANAAKIEPTRSVSACIGRHGRVRPQFKKKKKGTNAPFY